MSLSMKQSAVYRCGDTRPHTLEITWIAEQRIASGRVLKLRVPGGLGEWKATRINVTGADVIERCPEPETLVSFSFPYGQLKGQDCRFRINFVAPLMVDCTLPFEIVFEDGTAADPASLRLSAAPGPVYNLGLFARPSADADGMVRVIISPEDSCGNPTAFRQPIDVVLVWNKVEKTITFSKTCMLVIPEPHFVGRIILRFPLSVLDADETVRNATINGAEMIVISNPIWNRSQTKEIPLFGDPAFDFSEDSAGRKPLNQCLLLAKDFRNLDFAAACTSGIEPNEYTRFSKTVREVQNAEGDFLTICGTTAKGKYGRKTCYFSDPASARQLSNDLTDIGMLRFDPHFFTADPKGFDEAAEKTFVPDEDGSGINLIEIMNERGRLLGDDSLSELELVDMKPGFIASSHNNAGHPSRLPLTEPEMLHSVITGVWANERSRNGLCKALAARHCWAARDTRAIVMYTLNDMLMGGEVTVKTGDTLLAWVAVSAEAPVKKLVIWSDIGPVYRSSFDKVDLDVEITLETPLKEGMTCYYLEIELHNGGHIITSPVYVKVRNRIIDNLLASHDPRLEAAAKQALPDTKSEEKVDSGAFGYTASESHKVAEADEAPNENVSEEVITPEPTPEAEEPSNTENEDNITDVDSNGSAIMEDNGGWSDEKLPEGFEQFDEVLAKTNELISSISGEHTSEEDSTSSDAVEDKPEEEKSEE